MNSDHAIKHIVEINDAFMEKHIGIEKIPYFVIGACILAAGAIIASAIDRHTSSQAMLVEGTMKCLVERNP
jgi:hypothetical protein